MKIERLILAVLIFSLWSFLLCAEENREWTTVSGKTIQASFEKRNGDILHLRTATDNKPITVKYWDLRMADRKYVDDLQKARQGGSAGAEEKVYKPGEVGWEITGNRITTHDDRGTMVRVLADDEELVGSPLHVRGPNGTSLVKLVIRRLSPEEYAAKKNPTKGWSKKDLEFFSKHSPDTFEKIMEGKVRKAK